MRRFSTNWTKFGNSKANRCGNFFTLRKIAYGLRKAFRLPPVLVFDQFEEIFTLGRQTSARAAEAQKFFEELSDLIASRPPAHILAALERGDVIPFDTRPVPLRILLALREDFLPHLSQLRERGFTTIRRHELRIEPLNSEAARAVIERPVPKIVASNFADALLDFLAGASTDAHETSNSQSFEPLALHDELAD
jgi:hypothetical protein